jgi:hypothetical protein
LDHSREVGEIGAGLLYHFGGDAARTDGMHANVMLAPFFDGGLVRSSSACLLAPYAAWFVH